MKSKIKILLFVAAIVSSCGGPQAIEKGVDMEIIGKQVDLLNKNVQKGIEVAPVDSNGSVKLVPRTINEDGTLSVVPGGDWTSGFYPGVLWYMYELTGDTVWKGRAVQYTETLEEQQYNGSDHDVGFRMFCSYGNALHHTGNEDYIPVLIQSAKTLTGRYYESVGCIRSWDFNDSVWQCPVIIDNMMNLELLFWASEQTGDPVYRTMAVSHALTTMKHHFREDYSSVHVVDYDTITGEVRQRNTHQGWSDESAWARGQAWGLYGFTMTYRYTQDARFLHQAEKIAGFLLARLPEDGVPYWDFDAPGIPEEPRDVSAAAIISSALYELSTYSEKGAEYKSEADRILENIWTGYRCAKDENLGFILDHSVGSKPGNSEVNVPLIYADYYFLEALSRKRSLEK
ncbi:MAG: glycoside hydrolase family 88 protein [Bacteroidota bacterium]